MDQIVRLGENIRVGKALQLYLKDNSPYLIIGKSLRHHPDILAEFLRNQQIPFNNVELGANKVGPPPIDPAGQYRLVGAGWINCYKDRFELSDNSTIYGLSPDEKHAKEISDITGIKIIVKQPEPKPWDPGYASILKPLTLDKIC